MIERETADYLQLCLLHPAFTDFLSHDGMTGSDLPHITGSGVAEYPIALPPIEEQREIVQRVQALFAICDKIEARVAATAIRAERLVQATLGKAFRGELVPTEAELADKQGREFETAEALLRRLNADRAPLSRSAPSAPPVFSTGLFGDVADGATARINGIARGLEVLRSQWQPIRSTKPPFEDLVIEAFKAVCSQNSPDRVVADPELHHAFVEQCRTFGLQISEFELCFSLLNLRKGNEMKNLHSKREPVMNQWRYAAASEIAARVIYHRRGLSVDRIICDPEIVEEFEQVARSITPGFSSFEYRWAALGLRKLGRRAAQGVVERLRWSDPVSFTALHRLPNSEGLYVLQDGSDHVFVSGTKHIRETAESQIGLGTQDLFGQNLWRPDPERMFWKYAETDVRSTERHSIVTSLVNAWAPVLNVPRVA